VLEKCAVIAATAAVWSFLLGMVLDEVLIR
jgi:hypothetical protein